MSDTTKTTSADSNGLWNFGDITKSFTEFNDQVVSQANALGEQIANDTAKLVEDIEKNNKIFNGNLMIYYLFYLLFYFYL